MVSIWLPGETRQSFLEVGYPGSMALGGDGGKGIDFLPHRV